MNKIIEEINIKLKTFLIFFKEIIFPFIIIFLVQAFKPATVVSEKTRKRVNILHDYFIYISFGLIIFNINSFLTFIALVTMTAFLSKYFNKKDFSGKIRQIYITKIFSDRKLLFFIINWIVFSFGFAIAFFLVTLLSFYVYIGIFRIIEEMEAKKSYEEVFGEKLEKYDGEEIKSRHIKNLFENETIDITTINLKDIKNQYKKLAKKYHPDVSKEDNVEKFHSIKASYEYLITVYK